MASSAALELIISLQDNASKGLDNVAKKGGFLRDAFSFATGGLIEKGIESIGGAVTGFFGDMMQQSKDNQKGLAQLDAVLKSTGGSAGVTKDQVLGLVDSLSSAGGLSTAADDSVMAGENMLLTFTNIGKDVFPQATQTMLDMATAMNNGATPSAEELSNQAIQLGKALNDPKKGLTALQRVGVSFTNEQKAQIQGMQNAKDAADAYGAVVGELPSNLEDLLKGVTDSGKAMEIMSANGVKPLTDEQKKLFESLVAGNGTMEAQKVILAELGKEFGGSALASAQTFDGQMAHLGGVFDNVKQSLGDKLLPILTKALDFLGSPEVVAAIQGLADFLVKGLSNAIDTVSNAVQVAWPYVQPFVQAIIDFAKNMQSTGDLGASFGKLFTDLGAAISNAWSAVGPALGDLLGKIVQWIGDSVPTIAGALVSWDVALAKWVWDALPGLLAALGNLLTQVQTWVQANGPAILTQLQTWGQAFWQWIVDVTPVVMSNLGTFISGIWAWISANAPAIFQKLGEWGQAFLDWVLPMIPPLLGKLGELLLALGGWLIGTALPAIVQQLAKWGYELGQWIEPNIGPMIAELFKLSQRLGVWIVSEALPAIVNKLVEWGMAFTNWIAKDVLPTLPAKLAEIANALFQFFLIASSQIGDHLVHDWVPAMWTWITGPGGVLATINAKLDEIAQKIWTWVSGVASSMVTKMSVVGWNVVAGIQKGISDAWSGFLNWLNGMLGGLPQVIKDFFHIGSPSRLMADEIGAPLVQGIQQGWGEAWPALTTEIGDRFTVLQDGLKNGIPDSWRPLGLDMTIAVAEGMTQGLPDTQTKVNAWLGQISGGLSNIIPATWHPIGMTIAEQIAHGVSDGVGTALAAMTALMDALWGEAEKRAQEIRDLIDRTTKYGSPVGGPGSGNNNYQPGSGGGGGRGTGRGFASGGIPPVGQWSLVGENGPELFMPLHRGRIIPHDALRDVGMGGGVSITGPITIHAGLGANGREIAQDFLDELNAQLALSTRTRRAF